MGEGTSQGRGGGGGEEGEEGGEVGAVAEGGAEHWSLGFGKGILGGLGRGYW